MRLWLLLFAGMLVWALHFMGAYGIASVFDIVSEAEAPGSRWATGALTLACLLADAAVLALAVRLRRAAPAGEVEDWTLQLAALGAAGSFIAVAWQGLPALIIG